MTGRCAQDKTLHPFGAPPGGHIRLPGTWGGACANCRWKDHSAKCTFYNPNEPRFIPAPTAALPPPPLTALQQITNTQPAVPALLAPPAVPALPAPGDDDDDDEEMGDDDDDDEEMGDDDVEEVE